MYKLIENETPRIFVKGDDDYINVVLTFKDDVNGHILYACKADENYILYETLHYNKNITDYVHEWPPEVCGVVFMEDLNMKHNNNIKFD